MFILYSPPFVLSLQNRKVRIIAITEMKLHIFNPEHDLALASNKANFTPPHAARGLRSDVGFLPALWADDGDAVLVDNAEHAEKSLAKVAARLGRSALEWKRRHIVFVEREELGAFLADERLEAIEPWGWDATLRNSLLRAFNDAHDCNSNRHDSADIPGWLPSLDALDDIRLLSHRRTAAETLRRITGDGIVGEAFECTDIKEVEHLAAKHHRVVLKAPWSSSGRGIRFVDDYLDAHRTGWVKNLLLAQGSVMVEPFYNKVEDFGMEFHANGDGSVSYEGLSVFSTQNGAYTGNVLATESAKEEMLCRYIPKSLLDSVKNQIVSITAEIFKGIRTTNDNETAIGKGCRYSGPFGVDMMIVATDDEKGFLLHPCVEINLRRTMGHVAIALSPTDDDMKRVMRINYNKDNYQLTINSL